MDENVKQLCKKACIEYCEDGFVSEPVFDSLMKHYELLNFNEGEEIKAFMRNFISDYIQVNNLSWKSNTCICASTSLGVLRCFIISEIPKNLHILPF